MNYYNEIKNELLNNEINKKIKDYSKNRSDLHTYYNVGKILYDAGKHYGEGIIKNYSIKLTREIGKKYNSTNLKRMRQFYLMIKKGAPIGHQLSWSHYRELIPLKDINAIKYYIYLCERLNLTRNELVLKIRNREYERLDEETKSKIVTKNEYSIVDFVKNPILIRNNYNYEEISEKVLQKMILEDIPSFLEELGDGFTFIKNEYKIKIGDRYNYIDLLLYNIEFNCYVVVELKVTELKKEHIGQIEIYMNYIDNNLKRTTQDKTIGIIICKRDNKYIIEYASDKRILTREYVVI